MKKTLITLFALITFIAVLGGLFMYEKYFTKQNFGQQSEADVVEELLTQEDEAFLVEILEETKKEGVENITLENENREVADGNEVVEGDIEEKKITEPKKEVIKTDILESTSRIKEKNNTAIDESSVKEPVIERKKGFLYDDDSLQKFVSPDVSFYDISYVPERLFGIDHEYIIDAKGNGQLRPEALAAAYRMAEVFHGEFETELKLVSTYRSYAYQKGIKDRGCSDLLCAKAGYSEHQTGLAIDLWETSTNELFLGNKNYKKYFEWLQENAHRFGYHNSYQRGVAIDGYEIEPWHWRYVGASLATTLKEKNQTFTEYYKSNN